MYVMHVENVLFMSYFIFCIITLMFLASGNKVIWPIKSHTPAVLRRPLKQTFGTYHNLPTKTYQTYMATDQDNLPVKQNLKAVVVVVLVTCRIHVYRQIFQADFLQQCF